MTSVPMPPALDGVAESPEPAAPAWGDIRRIQCGGYTWNLCAHLVHPFLGDRTLRLEEWEKNGQLRTVKAAAHHTVYRLQIPEGVYYIKRFFAKGKKAQWRNRVGGPKALRELAMIRQAEQKELPGPQVVGWGTSQQNLACDDSFLILRSLDPALPLHDLLHRFSDAMKYNRDGIRGRQHLTVAIARLVARLHKAGFVHEDLHAEKITVAPAQTHGPIRLWWLDVADITATWLKTGRQDARRNFAALRHSVGKLLTSSDALRFLMAYAKEWTEPAARNPADLATMGDASPFASRIPKRVVKTQNWPWGGSMAAEFRALTTLCDQYNREAWKKADRQWEQGNRRLRIIQVGNSTIRGVAGFDREFLEAVCFNPTSLFAPPFLIQTDPESSFEQRALIHLPLPGGLVRAELVRRRAFGEAQERSWARHYWERAYMLMRRGFAVPGPFFIVESPGFQWLARSSHRDQQSIAQWIADQGRMTFPKGSHQRDAGDRIATTLGRLLSLGFCTDRGTLDDFLILTLNGRVHVALTDPSRWEPADNVPRDIRITMIRQLWEHVSELTYARKSLACRWLKRLCREDRSMTWRMTWAAIDRQTRQRRQDREERYAA